MRALEQNLTVIDFESTGTVVGYPDEPWQIGVVRLTGGRVRVESCFESLLHVADRPFSRHAPGRHAALRAEMVAAPRLVDLWPQLRPLLDNPLVAHHTATERRFLKRAFPLHVRGPWIDTLKLVRVARPELDSHTLADALASLQLTARVNDLLPGRAPHDALYDALSSAVLLEHLLAQPDWQDVTVATLAAARADAFHKRQTEQRRQNFRNV